MNTLLQLRDHLLFKIMYWSIRIGMALAFIASGLRKLPGVEFTILTDANPVGTYFKAMHDLGFYWNFIGYFQILVGLMAFWNRSSATAILLMMPVTVNIFLISVALNMRGTPIITACMLLGNTFLLLWHFEQFRHILHRPDPKLTRLRNVSEER